MFGTLKKFCDSFLELGVPGVDLAVFKGGKCVCRHFNGYSDLENKAPLKGKERYNIYSCSKVITCTAALQLMEKGLFALEDKLSDYMPEFAEMTVRTDAGVKKTEKPILIKHLFEMTAGFSYETETPHLKAAYEETNGKCPTRELMRYLAKEPLLFEPGDCWQYSLCHDVLAALVEVLSGVKFETYVKENIFDVLGMDDSTFMLPEAELDTLAQQYRFENGKAVNVGKEIVRYKLGSEYASGGAGAISTVDDYMKFLEGLRTFKLLKPETVKRMMTNRLNDQQMETFWMKNFHGYGLGVRCPKGVPNFVDFGWGGAAGAFLAIDMENEITLFCATHILNSPAQGIRSMLYRIAASACLGRDDMDEINDILKMLHNYTLTY